MRHILLAVVATLVWLVAPGAADAQRVALVVGNGAYRAVPQLSNPGRDADEVAEAFRRLGFQVRVLRDATRARFEAALQQFSQDATGAEVAAFYFAGHGIEVQGENLLIPVDARLSRLSDVDFQTVKVAAVLRAMQGARARLVFLDACRDNPFAATLRSVAGTRSVPIGLGRVETADLGTLVAFSTAPGTVAADGAGRNSPFAAALARHLVEPGLDIRQVMTRVRRAVVEETGGAQVPWDNSSLVSDVVLRPGPQAGAAVAAIPPRPSPAIPAPALQERDPWAVTRQLAAERGIPLPREIPAPARQQAGDLAHWIGAWWGDTPNGRSRIVIIPAVDPVTRQATIIFAESDPGSASVVVGQPRYWTRLRARLTPDELVFNTPWTYTLRFQTHGQVVVSAESDPSFRPQTRFTHMAARLD